MERIAAPQIAPAGRFGRNSLSVAAGFAMLAAAAAILPFIPETRIVALSLVFVGVGISVATIRLRSGSFDWFEAFFPITALLFFHFGVGTIYLTLFPKELPHISLFPFLEPALVLGVVGYLAFTLGYLTMFRSLPPSPTRWLRVKDARAIYVAGAVGFAGALATVLQGSFVRSRKYVSGSLSLVQQLAPLFLFAWALAWLVYFQRRERSRRAALPVAVLGLAVFLLVFLTIGGKAYVTMVMGIPAIAFWYSRKKLPVKAILALVLLVVFVVFPIYNVFKNYYRDGGTAERLGKTLVLAGKWDAGEYQRNTAWAAVKRLGVVSSVAAILRYTGRWVDYRHGETIFLAPISLFIPRLLWPGKPSITVGREFAESFDLVLPMDTETRIALTAVGEFYWNFHVPGVLVGMFLLGAGYHWIYRRFGKSDRNEPVRTAFYITLLCGIPRLEANVAPLLGSTVKTLIAFAVLVWVLRRLGLVEAVAPDGGAPAGTAA